MKKKLIVSFGCLMALSAFGQNVDDQDILKNVNWQEDSTEITTVDDIIKMQQDVTGRRFKESHFWDVWSRKSYFNISYNMTTLSPDQDIPSGIGSDLIPEYKSNWGVSLQLGRSYALHKNPIANLLQFNIDFTYVDLGANHFKIEGDGTNLYDSNAKFNYDGGDYYYTPWNLEKYEFNYGMAIGPSMTIAPFMSTNSRGLHYIKLNLYYHIGYHASFLWMQDKKEADANQLTDTDSKLNRDRVNDVVKMDLGHGLIQSFGFSVTWKFIGIGYEHRSAGLKYQSLGSSEFSKEKYKFSSSTNRVFLQIRM